MTSKLAGKVAVVTGGSAGIGLGIAQRFSGSSLGFHLASIIAGGPAPLIATALLAWTGSGYSIALYILASAVISMAATVPLPDYTNRDISGEPEYGSAPVGSAVPVEASTGD